jgi:capsular exopolysaccharide synthesis family protein
VRVYINFVWRHWMLVGAVVGLSLLLALIYLARATPLYTATAQVLLEYPERAPTDNGAGDRGFGNYAYFENQLAIFTSDPLLRRVVVKERLAATVVPSGGDGQSTDGSTQDVKLAEEQSILNAINSLRGALSVKRRGQAQVFDVSFTSVNADRAGELANGVADAYVVNQLDARFEAAKRASGWLSDRVGELRQQLRDSEDNVAKFRKEHGLAVGGPTVALNDQQLTELNSKLIAARTDVAEKKTRVDFLAEVAAGKKALDALPDSFQSKSSVMGALRAKLADASQREADLLARYNSRHPAVANVEAEKRDIENGIKAEAQRMANEVKNDYALAKARLDATERSMREATGQGGLDNDDGVRLRELERTAAVNKSMFEDFLQKAKITDEQSTFQARDARVIVPAQRGGKSFPNPNRVLLMALAAGLALGIGGAFAKEFLIPGFTTPREVEDALGVPVLASIRQMNKDNFTKDGTAIPLPFYHLHYPLSPYSEAMRSLRSGIHMSDVDRPPKIIHVTSSRPGEGKTTLAVSLAISAMSSGLKVVLVDMDLRHPAASQFFDLEKKKGLVDLLTESGEPKGTMMFQKDQLTIIPAGSKTMNPPDILASERMKKLVTYLRENFDYVVLDTPPVGPVIDASIVARLADKTVFVVQWASTPRDLVESCLKKVSDNKRVGGIVLNFVKEAYAKKYGGEYAYGSYYAKYYAEN